MPQILNTKRSRTPESNDEHVIDCTWCQHPTRNPFACPYNAMEWLYEFCSYECAEAYSFSGGQACYNQRHVLIQKKAGRSVYCAPWHSVIERVSHTEFLASARANLTPQEAAIALQQDEESFGNIKTNDSKSRR